LTFGPERTRRTASRHGYGNGKKDDKGSGWTFDHQRGSHRIWYSPTGYRLSAQEGRSGKAKGYQVEQFLRQYEVENEKVWPVRWIYHQCVFRWGWWL